MSEEKPGFREGLYTIPSNVVFKEVCVYIKVNLSIVTGNSCTAVGLLLISPLVMLMVFS